MPAQSVHRVGLGECIGHLIVGVDVLDVDEVWDEGAEVVEHVVDVLGPWPHSWGLGQSNRTTVVLEQLAHDLGSCAANGDSLLLHFLHQVHERDYLAKRLTETYVLCLCCAKRHDGLELTLPQQGDPKVLDDIPGARSCGVLVPLGILMVEVSGKVGIGPDLEILVLKLEDDSLVPGSSKIPANPFDCIAVLPAWICSKPCALMHCICDVWSGAFFEVIKLADDASIVEMLVEFWRRFVCRQ